MASIEQARREAMNGSVGFFGIVGTALSGISFLRTGFAAADAPARPQAETSEVFARAIAANSNSAMDWIYYASHLRDAERGYCLGRAIQLAYGDEIVLGEVRRLRRA
jgi:hypothetical protein